MIDRNFVKSDKLNQLPRHARLAYAMILPFLDRKGRAVAEPLVLKANIFRWSDYTETEIAECIAHLANAKLVRLYANHDNAAIIEYTRFSEFNTPNKKESASDLPGPDDDDAISCQDNAILAFLTGETPMHVQGTGNARAMQVENVNVNGNVNANENESMSPDGDARAPLATRESHDYQALLDAWNEHRGSLPAAQKVTSNRRAKLKTLIRDLGSFDKAHAAIAIAAREVAGDDFWQTRGYGFDNLLAGQKVIQKAETAWNRGTFNREDAEKQRMLNALGPN
jgi:hypothetical protein